LGGFTFITKNDKICFMKKFNRLKHKTMGAMPDELRKIAGLDAATATEVFNQYITDLATDFHAQLANGTDKSEIKLTPKSKLFGMDVKLDYVASGSIGSVYKIQIVTNNIKISETDRIIKFAGFAILSKNLPKPLTPNVTLPTKSFLAIPVTILTLVPQAVSIFPLASP
jgi:hypothetical protein